MKKKIILTALVAITLVTAATTTVLIVEDTQPEEVKYTYEKVYEVPVAGISLYLD